MAATPELDTPLFSKDGIAGSGFVKLRDVTTTTTTTTSTTTKLTSRATSPQRDDGLAWQRRTVTTAKIISSGGAGKVGMVSSSESGCEKVGAGMKQGCRRRVLSVEESATVTVTKIRGGGKGGTGMVMMAAEEDESPPIAPPAQFPTSQTTTLKRTITHEQSHSYTKIARFYFPHGNPSATNSSLADPLLALKPLFTTDTSTPKRLTKEEFIPVVEHLGLPRYTSWALFHKVASENGVDASFQDVERVWKKIRQTCHDDESRLFSLMKSDDGKFLRPRDFHNVIQ
ncbi:hypothetical protein HK097_005302, partial [Rhizophlyctis rosea]